MQKIRGWFPTRRRENFRLMSLQLQSEERLAGPALGGCRTAVWSLSSLHRTRGAVCSQGSELQAVAVVVWAVTAGGYFKIPAQGCGYLTQSQCACPVVPGRTATGVLGGDLPTSRKEPYPWRSC